MSPAAMSETIPDDTWYATIRARLRLGFILGIVGYVLVIGVIGATLWSLSTEIRAADVRLAGVRAELEKVTALKEQADRELADSRRQVQEMQKAIYDFGKHVVTVSEVDAKMALVGGSGKSVDILVRAMQDASRGIKFGAGETDAAGYTSPGYAAHLLASAGVTGPINSLPARQGTPRNGDIFIYAGNYTMFYYRIQNKEFVIGMTPLGVLALDPAFGTRTSVIAGLTP
jgi:hypothetical protein